MARYKVARPIDHRYILAKKRERIRKCADAVYVVLLLAGILICGINQRNDVVVGWGLIAMGILSVPAAVFHIYVDKKEWKPLFWYDNPETRQYIDKKTREKDLSEYRLIRTFEIVFLILFSIGLPAFGVLRLLGIL